MMMTAYPAKKMNIDKTAKSAQTLTVLPVPS